MTNLICAIVVTLVTNTTEQVTKWERMVSCPHPINTYAGGYIYNNDLWMEGQGPLEKLIITTVTERKVLKFDWDGPREVVQERTLSTSAKQLSMKSEWVTNAIPYQPQVAIWSSGGTGTNGIVLNGSLTNSLTLTNPYAIDIAATNIYWLTNTSKPKPK